ncbi:response regulator transcription factor [Verrucomicrobium sp. BvORR106]|uniref:response regulator n=1 Tax=Verrucomicrobium sp. BvORR106 TaxID=1403819 RepID=UPI0009DF60A0|nr:response regulator transcription factor [Verrucomicrobium sp. BvORR106]
MPVTSFPPSDQHVVSIAVVDDHSIICAVFRSIAEDSPGLSFAWSAPDVRQGAAALKRELPGILVVDVNLPDGSGYELARQTLQEHRHLKVLVVSTNEGRVYSEQAYKAGARGYVNKNTSPDELLHAINTIRSGGTYFNPALKEPGGI